MKSVGFLEILQLFNFGYACVQEYKATTTSFDLTQGSRQIVLNLEYSFNDPKENHK